MDFTTMTIEQLQERRVAIATECEAEGADVNALLEEVRAINAELEARAAAEASRAEIRTQVANGAGIIVNSAPAEERTHEMTLDEIRASREYVNAYANYLRSSFRGHTDDSEARALLTTNATNGVLPVPTIVEDVIRTAWQKTGLMELITKTYVRGNLNVPFELSATDAVIHTEGAAAPTEETLTFGVVSLVPSTIKKWIRISDEALDMGGEEFLNYIYDELAYKIARKAQETLLGLIADAASENSKTAVGVPSIVGAPDLGIVANAYAQLSDEASDITVVMNRLTHAAFIKAIADNGYLFNPFEGYRVVYDNTLPAYADAEDGKPWLIVGDFKGAQANFPNGETITIKFDDLSEAEADLVKVVGREYVAIGIVGPGMFAKVTKASVSE